MKDILERRLKLWHIIAIGLGYMAPMAVFDTFGIVTEVTDGHVPAAYTVTLIAILFTALSYGHMVKAFPGAGSAYTYAQQSINSNVGFLVGWAAILDYLFLPMINALLTAIYLSAIFPDVPGWIWIVGFVLILTVFNIFSVQLTVSFGAVLVLFQVITAILFILLSAGQSYAQWSTAPFTDNVSVGVLFAGASILCFSFLGFDAVTTLSEETIEPKKTIPKGILIIALTGGLLFITVSFFAQILFPSAAMFSDVEGASAEIAYKIGGTLFQSVFVAAALTSTIASGLASHMSASRLLFAISRDGFLPKRIFSYVHPRTKTPMWNIILIGVLSLTAVLLSLEMAASLINFGALTAFSAVNISVIMHYYVKQKRRSAWDTVRFLIAPLLGSVFIFFLWTSLEATSLILGLSWSMIGALYLLYVRKMKKINIPTFHFE
ncbi:APC family permease [Ectobacillus sp. JY-23]|uniref:APC family permease n=1 Tax=Ectobacillus sp. JY-23 TaxID=2933872 RepID=UPI001FF65BA5|nr:APC family permease [Ectobacillus sp. JY-23]UOY91671.1 APC family permease [Ectobacillus sp. JY-23]